MATPLAAAKALGRSQAPDRSQVGGRSPVEERSRNQVVERHSPSVGSQGVELRILEAARTAHSGPHSEDPPVEERRGLRNPVEGSQPAVVHIQPPLVVDTQPPPEEDRSLQAGSLVAAAHSRAGQEAGSPQAQAALAAGDMPHSAPRMDRAVVVPVEVHCSGPVAAAPHREKPVDQQGAQLAHNDRLEADTWLLCRSLACP